MLHLPQGWHTIEVPLPSRPWERSSATECLRTSEGNGGCTGSSFIAWGVRAVAETEEKGWRWWLQHLMVPVVLTIVTVVGAFIATNIQSRHDRQKELDFKSTLFSKMSSATTGAVVGSQAVADRTSIRRVLLYRPKEAPLAFQDAFDDIVRVWRLDSAEIDTSLTSYFGLESSACWEAYSSLLDEYILLSATPGTNRTRGYRVLRDFRRSRKCLLLTAVRPGQTDWKLTKEEWTHLKNGLPPSVPIDPDTRHPVYKRFLKTPKGTRYDFRQAYRRLGDEMLKMGRPLIASLVTQHAKGF